MFGRLRPRPYLMSEPLLAFLYMTLAGSAMTGHDVVMAGQALECLRSLPGFVLVVLAPGFFAHQGLNAIHNAVTS